MKCAAMRGRSDAVAYRDGEQISDRVDRAQNCLSGIGVKDQNQTLQSSQKLRL